MFGSSSALGGGGGGDPLQLGEHFDLMDYYFANTAPKVEPLDPDESVEPLDPIDYIHPMMNPLEPLEPAPLFQDIPMHLVGEASTSYHATSEETTSSDSEVISERSSPIVSPPTTPPGDVVACSGVKPEELFVVSSSNHEKATGRPSPTDDCSITTNAAIEAHAPPPPPRAASSSPSRKRPREDPSVSRGVGCASNVSSPPPEDPFNFSKAQLRTLTSAELEQRVKSVVVCRPLTDTEERKLKRQRRLIKNRESAQLSRQRKKQYVEDLERKCKLLQDANQSLRNENHTLKIDNQTLLEDIGHLEKAIRSNPHISNDVLTRKFPASSISPSIKTAGVCLLMVLFSFGLFFNAQGPQVPGSTPLKFTINGAREPIPEVLPAGGAGATGLYPGRMLKYMKDAKASAATAMGHKENRALLEMGLEEVSHALSAGTGPNHLDHLHRVPLLASQQSSSSPTPSSVQVKQEPAILVEQQGSQHTPATART